MSTDPERSTNQSEPRDSKIFVGGGLVIPTQPEEVAYPLVRETFDTLIEGEITNKDERWRDISISIFSTSLLSMLTMLVTIDWNKITVSQNLIGFLLVILIAAITVATSVLMVIFICRARKPVSSSYSRTRDKIVEWFNHRGDKKAASDRQHNEQGRGSKA